MVVLATKCYVAGDARNRALDGMNALVDNAVGELDVEWTVGVRSKDEFVQVEFEGEDATVAENLLAEEWGEIPEEMEPGGTYVGTLESWDDAGFILDAGRPIEVPADELGLGPGTPEQLVKRYGLVQHLPMRFVAGEPPRLADAERDRLYDWTRGTGRVNVNSATRGEVRATVNRAGHAHDIVTVERLGLLEQSIVCTEDTDPPGLLAAIGEYLPAELRCVVP
ncbi:hypothetical protein AArcSl_2039 [Halalkaliarchaeum desulfuricum]|uniref:DUF2110 family protein n=1 Tax=Halalkaliarchaeum desulfuricum TaxID=2055893 RepID=A0A343TKP2_9EURY|nr:DUF2110 family protein [Halalkaliarchaeum desulfuricum]AUX09664.1 hypothetical protein AArcSl_2039 [Halalkaliarchaeum desulfuricum]